MIRKIIILGLILLSGYLFYEKFIADTLNPFIGKIDRNKGKIDLFQQKLPDYKVDE